MTNERAEEIAESWMPRNILKEIQMSNADKRALTRVYQQLYLGSLSKADRDSLIFSLGMAWERRKNGQ